MPCFCLTLILRILYCENFNRFRVIWSPRSPLGNGTSFVILLLTFSTLGLFSFPLAIHHGIQSGQIRGVGQILRLGHRQWRGVFANRLVAGGMLKAFIIMGGQLQGLFVGYSLYVRSLWGGERVFIAPVPIYTPSFCKSRCYQPIVYNCWGGQRKAKKFSREHLFVTRAKHIALSCRLHPPPSSDLQQRWQYVIKALAPVFSYVMTVCYGQILNV